MWQRRKHYKYLYNTKKNLFFLDYPKQLQRPDVYSRYEIVGFSDSCNFYTYFGKKYLYCKNRRAYLEIILINWTCRKLRKRYQLPFISNGSLFRFYFKNNEVGGVFLVSDIHLFILWLLDDSTRKILCHLSKKCKVSNINKRWNV